MFVVLDDDIHYWAAASCPSFLVEGLEGKTYRRMILWVWLWGCFFLLPLRNPSPTLQVSSVGVAPRDVASGMNVSAQKGCIPWAHPRTPILNHLIKWVRNVHLLLLLIVESRAKSMYFEIFPENNLQSIKHTLQYKAAIHAQEAIFVLFCCEAVSL